MASREYESFLSAFEADLIDPLDSLERAREKLELLHGHPIDDETSIDRVTLEGVPCAWVDTPESRGEDRILLLCHGGAYVAAGGDAYLFYAEMLSRPCRARVLLVDYRLAPEHRHPAALDDCAAAYRGLLGAGHAPGRIAFIGDSCGGSLAVGALLKLRDQDVPMPAACVTLGGWFDLEADGDSARSPVGRDPFAHRDFTRARGRDYVGPEGDVRDPLASPIHADLRGLPPLLLQVGQVDLTRDDALRLADRAGRQGVAVRYEVHSEMMHGFQGLARAGIPEAQVALEQAGAFVGEQIP